MLVVMKEVLRINHTDWNPTSLMNDICLMSGATWESGYDRNSGIFVNGIGRISGARDIRGSIVLLLS